MSGTRTYIYCVGSISSISFFFLVHVTNYLVYAGDYAMIPVYEGQSKITES